MSSTSSPNQDAPASRWPGGIRALSYRDYRLMWIGSVVSNVGTWMQITAQAWVIYEISGHNEFWLGADAFAAGVPVILTPFAGVLADRVSRKRLMGVVTVLQAVVAAFLALMLALDRLLVWEIIACSAVSGLLSTLMVPTFISLMPDLVDRKDLPNAVALNSMGFNCSRVVGPMVGGYVLYIYGAKWSFAMNALSFSAVIAALMMIRKTEKTSANHPHPWHSLLQGLRYLRGRSDLPAMLALVLGSGIFAAPIFTMLPAYARVCLNRPDEAAYANLLSVFGVGAVAGSLALALASHKIPSPWRSVPYLLALGAVEIALGWVSSYHLALVLVTIAGALLIGTLARLNTAMVSSTPNELRGRLTSFFFLAIAGGIPIGGLLAGVVSRATEVNVAFWVFGGLLICAIAVIGLIVKRKGIQFQSDYAVNAELTAEEKLAESMI